MKGCVMKGCVQRFAALARAAVGTALTAVCLVGGAVAEEQTLVLPRGGEERAGSTALRILPGDSVRFQQFFSSDALASEMPKGAWITGISFRQDDGSRGFSGELTFESVEVILSTADPTPIINPNRTFANNLASDATTVSSLAPIRWSLQHLPGRVNPFQMSVEFSTLFLYDPRQGNLLIDVRLMSASSDVWVDLDSSSSVPRDTAWYVWGRTGDPPENVSDLTSGYFNRGAFDMRLEFFPVPEPSARALLGIGFAAIMFSLRRVR